MSADTDHNMNGGHDRTRRTVTILLALAGIGTMIAYTACETACSYLQGEVLGIDLKYVGIVFMATVGTLAWLNKIDLLRLLLAGGVGAEVFLLWFQFKEGIYCPYCLVFMTCLVIAFAVHYKKPQTTGWKRIYSIPGEVRLSETERPLPLILFMLAGFGLIWLTFSGSTLPAYAADPGIRVYGRGKMEIRVYTDYLCVPCREAEQRMEPLLKHIVGKKKGRVLFIDTPMHKETFLYARYYLYAMAVADDNFITALQIRRALFEAAEKEIKTPSELETFLKDRQIPFNSDNPKPTAFKAYNDYLRADQVKSTPTVVVVTSKGKGSHTRAFEIIEALEKIKKGTYRATTP